MNRRTENDVGYIEHAQNNVVVVTFQFESFFEASDPGIAFYTKLAH